MIIAASIISRSASGSAYFPNSDSTCQRRASQPSTWSVIAGDARRRSRRPSCARRPRSREQRRRRPGSARSRAIVSAFGSFASSGSGARRLPRSPKDSPPRSPRKRQNPAVTERLASRASSTPTPTPSSAAARTRRGRRLLGVARGDARRGRAADAGDGARPSTPRPTARCAPPATPRSASSTTSGSEEALAAAEAAAEAGIELVLLLAAYGRGGLARFRQESSAEYLAPGRGAARARASRVGRRPPLRPRLPGRLARGDRPLRRGRRPAAARPRRRAAARDRGVPRRARRAADRAARADRLPRPADDRRPRHARGARRARPRSPTPARASACARRPRRTSATASRRSPRCCERGIGICIGSDSNVRIDPLEELRELEGIARRAGRPAQRRLARRAARASARTRAPPRSAWTRGPTSRSTSATRRCAASTTRDVLGGARLRLRADVFAALELPGVERPATRTNAATRTSCGRGTRAPTPCRASP